MTHQVCVVPGDGIGQEVVPAAVEVLRATGLPLRFVWAEAGWACFQAWGTPLPPETLRLVRESDAVLFGATASPSGAVPGYQSPILTLRQTLDLFANLRPVRSWPLPGCREGVDLLLVRENTEDLYVRQERGDGERAVAERVVTRRASQRVARVACQLARARRGRLTVVHKANVLPQTCGLFRQAVLEVAATFPDLEVEELLVDTAALHLVQAPERFDVLVTTNLFGDILSDAAAGLVGGLGLAPAGNIGEGPGVFEPVHGAAPDIAGRGIANPLATILSGAMLLRHLGYGDVACQVEAAVEDVVAHGPHTPDLGGRAPTREVTAAVVHALETRRQQACRNALATPNPQSKEVQ
ncbi:MAG: isocitrate/isopropylmalate dehydrogenase family protein [Anaerolineae bacterium]|nr:isocitrate/isopropylmalate dehydrogenase family protein [Anaerolineae bacterium]